jgi:hypothetical protein|tara:strand:- start:298 stop:603 length:306 start_codon:yes stop_codon:yes gene_type:complete
MVVIVLDDLIEKLVEFLISIVGSSINTNTRILVSNSGENACLEGYTSGAFLVFVLFPNLFGAAFFACGFRLGGEESIEVTELISVGKTHVVGVFLLCFGNA